MLKDTHGTCTFLNRLWDLACMYPYICFLEPVPRNSNFWALHMRILDAISHIIFIVFYVLHVRSLLQSSVFIGWGMMALLIQKLLPARTPGEETGWAVDTDLTGGVLCSVCVVGSWSVRRERCHVYLSARCSLFPEKWDLHLRRKVNTSGSGISADMKNNLCWGVEEIQKKF